MSEDTQGFVNAKLDEIFAEVRQKCAKEITILTEGTDYHSSTTVAASIDWLIGSAIAATTKYVDDLYVVKHAIDDAPELTKEMLDRAVSGKEFFESRGLEVPGKKQ